MMKNLRILAVLILALFMAGPARAELENDPRLLVSSTVRCDEPPDVPPEGWYE